MVLAGAWLGPAECDGRDLHGRGRVRAPVVWSARLCGVRPDRARTSRRSAGICPLPGVAGGPLSAGGSDKETLNAERRTMNGKQFKETLNAERGTMNGKQFKETLNAERGTMNGKQFKETLNAERGTMNGKQFIIHRSSFIVYHSSFIIHAASHNRLAQSLA